MPCVDGSAEAGGAAMPRTTFCRRPTAFDHAPPPSRSRPHPRPCRRRHLRRLPPRHAARRRGARPLVRDRRPRHDRRRGGSADASRRAAALSARQVGILALISLYGSAGGNLLGRVTAAPYATSWANMAAERIPSWRSPTMIAMQRQRRLLCISRSTRISFRRLR